MAVYPAKIKLPYRVGNRWLEERTLAGELVTAEHDYTVELDRLDEHYRSAAVALVKAVDLNPSGFDYEVPIEIVGSGLDPSATILEGRRRRYMTERVIRELGAAPILPEPVSAAEPLIDAWTAYVERYTAMSRDALKVWIDEFFSDEVPPDDDGKMPNGASTSWWWLTLDIVMPDGTPERVPIYARDDLDAFHVARGAKQLLTHARRLAGREHFDFACKLANKPLRPAVDDRAIDIAQAYLAKVEKIADLALARSWIAQRQKDGFELEMLRWSQQHGSDRLRMGVVDGYRMMPVYLRERLTIEAPGFYAHLAKDSEKVWQPRTGPSEEALLLRRAVVEKLKTASPYMGPLPKVEIGWIKEAPEPMVDGDHGWEVDGWGNREHRLDSPFEAIVVPDYLGRYVLIAGVWTDEEDQPPTFLKNEFILNPVDYAIDGLPSPPGGISVARSRQEGTPVDMGDFAPRTAPTADDDIPF